MTPYEFWLAAAEWGSYMTGGDPGACMYGFDERGCVQSEDHRLKCLDWISRHCRHAANGSDTPDEDHAQLDAMQHYLENAEIG